MNIWSHNSEQFNESNDGKKNKLKCENQVLMVTAVIKCYCCISQRAFNIFFGKLFYGQKPHC